MNRVVISGIGVVSPVGSSLDEFWTALVEARSGIGPLTIIPTERLSTRIAAQVTGFDPEAHFSPKQARLLDRFAQFAVFAARAALRDAQCEISEEVALDAATVPIGVSLPGGGNAPASGKVVAVWLIVDGNPLEDIGLLERTGESLLLIVKEGRIVKDALTASTAFLSP